MSQRVEKTTDFVADQPRQTTRAHMLIPNYLYPDDSAAAVMRAACIGCDDWGS